MKKPSAAFLGVLIAVLFAVGSYAVSEAVADEKFYRGKTVRIIVQSPPGGFFDLWARLLARHMGRYIPGNPSMIVQNMPGGGGVIAANYLYAVAKPDGLTFGTVIGSLYLMQVAGLPGAEFNWPEFTFIGRTRGDVHVFYIHSDLPYRNWRDVRAAKEPIPVGASGRGSTYIVPKVMEDVLGFNLRVISGYPGGAPIDAAMERGEVAGSARGASVYAGREPYLTWHKKGFVRAIAQTGKQRDPQLDANVPTVWEIAQELRVPEADLKFMETAYRGGDEWYWLYIAPPGLSMERATILREAFHKALDDPRLREEGAKIGLFPDPVDPNELQRAAAAVMDVDAKIAERIKNLLGP